MLLKTIFTYLFFSDEYLSVKHGNVSSNFPSTNNILTSFIYLYEIYK